MGPAVFVACSSEEKSTTGQLPPVAGFTFFNVGSSTEFSDTLRGRLEDQLSDDAIQYRNTIDLEIREKGFLKKHFPVLHELNLRLNTPLGERVEHKTVKLMYRYATRKNLPFSYVELVFSNYTGHPIYIHIRSRKDISAIIQTLEEKYGPPAALDIEDRDDKVLFWKDQRDVILVSVAATKAGDLEFRMTIYYLENIQELIQAEKEERRVQEERRKKAAERAF